MMRKVPAKDLLLSIIAISILPIILIISTKKITLLKNRGHTYPNKHQHQKYIN